MPGSQPSFRLPLISVLGGAVGITAGIVAYGLYTLIALCSNLVYLHRVSLTLPSLKDHVLGNWILVVPALGGLAVGIMAHFGTSKIRGHGIPEAIEAVLVNRSRIAPRVAILKPLSAAIAIGTGGPFGAEGPIIQTGGAIGSLLGQVIRTTASERKVLLACGAAAGMAATFSTPIAAVIFAIEMLLFEFKSRSFIPLVIASTLATAVHFLLMGPGAMFAVPHVDFAIPLGIPFYLAFGALCGLVAAALHHSLYWVEDQFARLPIDEIWWPALGGLGLGAIGLVMPNVLGVGYDVITDILSGSLPLKVLALIAVFKAAALLVSLGSGTSGGLLAPTFMVGGALGGIFAILADRVFPGLHLEPAAFALVGMAAVFAAASRSTFAFIVFAFELTRDYDAVLPLMLASVVASGVARLFMRESIMTEKLARRGLAVQQEYEVDVFQQTRVEEVMDRQPMTIAATTPVTELAERIAAGDPALGGRHGMPILDGKGRLAGIITRGDVLQSIEHSSRPDLTVLEAGNRTPIVTYPDEMLHDAIARMLQHDVGRLPVVARDEPVRLVGYLGRADILKARLPRLQEEYVREAGWVGRGGSASAT